MSDTGAVDIGGSALLVGDLVTIRGKISGSAGGTNTIVLQLLRPAADDEGAVDTVRTGAEQTDILTNFDAAMVLKD